MIQTADLVTFTEEILQKTWNFFRSVKLAAIIRFLSTGKSKNRVFVFNFEYAIVYSQFICTRSLSSHFQLMPHSTKLMFYLLNN